MQGKDLFEYAVIRIVPRVEREEFLNAGVVLYCAKQQFLQLKYNVEANRLLALCIDCDITVIQDHLHAFEQIALGQENSGPIGKLLHRRKISLVDSDKKHYCSNIKSSPRFL